MQEILRQKRIKHEKSVAYTPKQNDAAERENRSVTEAAQSMIYAKRYAVESVGCSLSVQG